VKGEENFTIVTLNESIIKCIIATPTFSFYALHYTIITIIVWYPQSQIINCLFACRGSQSSDRF